MTHWIFWIYYHWFFIVFEQVLFQRKISWGLSEVCQKISGRWLKVVKKCRPPCLGDEEKYGLKSSWNGKFRTFFHEISVTLTGTFLPTLNLNWHMARRHNTLHRVIKTGLDLVFSQNWLFKYKINLQSITW